MCGVSSATSSGRRDGLSSTELGACYYNNMRLLIHVCCDNSGQFSLYPPHTVGDGLNACVRLSVCLFVATGVDTGQSTLFS